MVLLFVFVSLFEYVPRSGSRNPRVRLSALKKLLNDHLSRPTSYSIQLQLYDQPAVREGVEKKTPLERMSSFSCFVFVPEC